MSDTSDYDVVECDYKEESTLVFHLLMSMGYSREEIQVRRQFGKWYNLWSCLTSYFPTDEPEFTIVSAGSRNLGLEGNDSQDIYNSDFDSVILYDKYDVRYGDHDIGNSSVATDLIDLNLITINNPETFIEDIRQYPGYVKLFQINQGRKMYFSNNLYQFLNSAQLPWASTVTTGPAITQETFYLDDHTVMDLVPCRLFKGWPSVANEWLSRKRPNNWPSPEAIRVIKSQGWLVAPVGHFDSDDKHSQWRLSIKDETYLFSQLNHIQMLCYVILKWILKLELKVVAEDSICSFHIKNLIFWCAEKLSCNWTSQHLLICIQKCIETFRKCITEHKLPHWFIKERNLLNSKLTKVISKDVAKLLLKYETNILKVLEFFTVPDISVNRCMYNIPVDDLKRKKLISVIKSCFQITHMLLSCCNSTMLSIMRQFEFFGVSERLKHYQKLFHYLSLNKCVPKVPFICQVRRFVDVLISAQRMSPSNNGFIIAAKRILKEKNEKHLPFMVLRLATSMYMEHKYEYVIQLCLKYGHDDTKTMDYSTHYLHNTYIMIENWLSVLPTSDLYTIKDNVLATFYDAWDNRTSCIPTSPLADELLSRFKNLLQSCNGNYNVFLLKNEMQNVPEVMCFELLSAKISPGKCFKEINLSTNLCTLLILFLSYIDTGQNEEGNKTLKSMEFYIEERHLDKMREERRTFDVFYNQIRHSKELYEQPITSNEPQFQLKSEMPNYPVTLLGYVYEDMHQLYNIVAYCNLKAHHYKRAANCILKSLTIFSSKKNAAYGYLKIIIFVLKQVDVTCIVV